MDWKCVPFTRVKWFVVGAVVALLVTYLLGRLSL
jgi:hypothetical protein